MLQTAERVLSNAGLELPETECFLLNVELLSRSSHSVMLLSLLCFEDNDKAILRVKFFKL